MNKKEKERTPLTPIYQRVGGLRQDPRRDASMLTMAGPGSFRSRAQSAPRLHTDRRRIAAYKSFLVRSRQNSLPSGSSNTTHETSGP